MPHVRKEPELIFYDDDGNQIEHVIRGFHEITVVRAFENIGVGSTITIKGKVWLVVRQHWNLSATGAELETVELEESDDQFDILDEPVAKAEPDHEQDE